MNDRAKNNSPRRPWFTSLWMIGGAFAFACLLSGLAAGLMWVIRPAPAPIQAATALLEVIPAPTTETIPSWTAPSATATNIADQTPSSTAEITIGAFVQIGDTGGTGLRLRSKSGLDGEVLLVAVDSEVFRVDDGPVEGDGYTWWYLVGPFDDARKGWAVSNYLSVVQNPQ